MLLNLSTLENLEEKISALQTATIHLTLCVDFKKRTHVNALPFLSRQLSHITLEDTYSYSQKLVPERSPESGEWKLKGYNYRMKIGRYFRHYIRALPCTVHSLAIKINHAENLNLEYELSRFYDFKELIKGIKKLPPFIRILDLSGIDLRENTNIPANKDTLAKLYRSIPPTLKTLIISEPLFLSSLPGTLHSLTLSKASEAPPGLKNDLFTQLHPAIQSISLSNNLLYTENRPYLLLLLSSLPKSVLNLDLGGNGLWRLNEDDLNKIITSLPPNLQKLGLRLNYVESYHPTFERILVFISSLPRSIQELDIGNNHFLHLAEIDDFYELLLALPQSVKRLRLCEDTMLNIPPRRLAKQLSLLPPSIDTLILSNSDLFSLPASYFKKAISQLPQTVQALDISANNLGSRPNELITLLAGVNAFIKKLSLRQNHLGCLDYETWKSVFVSLPQSLEEIDLSQNGLENLYPQLLRQYLDCIPTTVTGITLDEDQFAFRNDKSLIPCPAHFQHYGLFKLRGSLIQQKEFAFYKLAFTQLIATFLNNQFNLELINHILAYVFPQSGKQSKVLGTALISSILPRSIMSGSEQQSLQAVQMRIENLAPNAQHLDLSRCGLNRIISRNAYNSLFDTIPKHITSLSLRNNGFDFNSITLDRLPRVLQCLTRKPHIVFVDLSGHGFARYETKRLKTLLKHLPKTVKLISLGDEKPITPAQQVARRIWPKSFQKLTAKTENDLQKAHALLTDYTQNDSAWSRFLHRQWHSHNVSSVTILIKKIECGLINTVDELLFEVEQIPLANPAGSLSRRLTYLDYATYFRKKELNRNSFVQNLPVNYKHQ